MRIMENPEVDITEYYPQPFYENIFVIENKKKFNKCYLE